VDYADFCGCVLVGGGEFVLQVPRECGAGAGDFAAGRAAVFLLEPNKPKNRGGENEHAELRKRKMPP
jgi:hypothetical protein